MVLKCLFFGLTLNQDVFKLWLVQGNVFFLKKQRNSLFRLFSRIWVKRHFPIEGKSRIFTKSLFRLEPKPLVLFTTEKREVSFANNLTSVVRPRERSLI